MRDIRPNILFAVGCDALQQQSRSATDLQHASRVQRQDTFYRAINTLQNLLFREGLSGVAIYPDTQVNGLILCRERLPAIDFIKDRLPIRYLLTVILIARPPFLFR